MPVLSGGGSGAGIRGGEGGTEGKCWAKCSFYLSEQILILYRNHISFAWLFGGLFVFLFFTVGLVGSAI